MAEIERVLRSAGQPIAYVLDTGRRRCGSANAYRPTYAAMADGSALPEVAEVAIVTIECAAPAGYPVASSIDHHHPGDPGYGATPAGYLAASSLGQLLARLGIKPNAAQQLIAAADHCLAAAYAGHCPGVDPDELMTWRAESRAAFQRRSVAAVLADVDAARRALLAAPRVMLGGCEVADLRGQNVPELPEAAAREGLGFLSCMPAGRGDPRMKHGIMAAPAAAIAAWMAAARETGDLADLYGNPERGFAGGYST